jgi:hypothetical protein
VLVWTWLVTWSSNHDPVLNRSTLIATSASLPGETKSVMSNSLGSLDPSVYLCIAQHLIG